MRRIPAKRSSYSVATLGAAVAAVSFVTTLQLSAAPPPGLMLFDRSLKGDRLQVAPGTTDIRPTARPNPALPDGCLPVDEGHRNIFASEVPGRCVA